jgi:hypothetical protein
VGVTITGDDITVEMAFAAVPLATVNTRTSRSNKALNFSSSRFDHSSSP